jgi:hypothetical protein
MTPHLLWHKSEQTPPEYRVPQFDQKIQKTT